MSRPKGTFTDRLDEYLESATELEIRDLVSSIRTWARWKKLPFRVEIKDVKLAETPLLDQETK